MKFYFILLLLFSFCASWGGQQDGVEVEGTNVVGMLVDDQNNPVMFATVRLLREDSTLIKATVSGVSGEFTMRARLFSGNYILTISSLEYHSETIPITFSSEGEFEIPTIKMHAITRELAEAVVVGQRQFIEQQGATMIVNVDANQSAASSNALELLQKTPGVFFNRQSGALVLNGRQGVMIQMNGRTVRYSNEQLAEMLANMSGSSITKIEIISTPMANADAEGAGGVINLVLKKSASEGTNGECSASVGMGMNPRGKWSTLLNHHNSKYNLFGDLSTQYDKYFYNEQGVRYVYFNDNKTTLNNSLDRTRTSTPLSLRLGGDYLLDTTNSLSLLMLFNTVKTSFVNDSKNNISQTANNAVELIQQNANIVRTGFDLLTNCNYEHRFVDLKSSMTANVDWFVSDYRRNADYLGSSTSASEWNYHNPIRNELNVLTMQIDYKQPLSESSVVTLGTKNTSTNRRDNSSFQNVLLKNNDEMKPVSQGFQFTESIQAFYAQMETKLNSKWQLAYGVRTEYLRRSASLSNDSVTRNTREIQLFPSGSVSYLLKDGWQWVLAYSRRITRPPYRSMSPVRIYSDPFSNVYGNPDLKPQISNTISLATTLSKVLTITPSFTLNENQFASLSYQNDTNNTISMVTTNIRKQSTYSMAFGFNKPITKRLNVVLNVQCGHDALELLYNNQTYTKSFNWLYTTFESQYMLPKNWTLQCSAWRVSDMNQGFENSKALGSVSASIKKTIGSVSMILLFNDIFHTYKESKSADFFNYHYQTNGWSDTRQIWLTVKYRFGNKKVTKSAKRSYDASEIKQRAGE